MDCYLKEDSAPYDTLRSQTHLGGNGPAAVPVKVIKGPAIEILIGNIIFSKKETLRHMTLRRQTHLGGNGPFAFTVQIVEGLAKYLL
jgi:hypothetical protein